MNKGSFKRISDFLNRDIFPTRISSRILSLFLKQLSLLLNSGISLDNALSIIIGQNIDKKLTKSLRKVLDNLNNGLNAYESFYIEKESFDPLLISFIKSGDESGRLGDVLDEFSDFLFVTSNNKSKIREAFIYPITLLIVTVIVIGLIINLVMPTFIASFEDANMVLPLSTRILISISDFFSEYWILILAMIVTTFLMLALFYRKDDYRLAIDYALFKYLPLKRFRMLNVEYKLTSLLYILKNGGIDIIKSMDIISASYRNTYIQEKFYYIKKDLLEGRNLSECFDRSEIFSNMLVSMLEIGETSGKLEESLKKASEYYSNEYIYKLKKFSKLAEPILILIMAFIVGFVVFSVTIPMFDSVNSLY